MSNRAWVTLATNDSYGLGALVLAHSLRRASSAYPAVVLITPSVTEPMRDRLRAVFADVITVDVLDSRDAAHLALLQRPELGITFTKIHCWNLTQYEKCVFLDADTLIIQNCDELFDREELSAAPDVGWPDCFNSGVFVFRPSVDIFNDLIKFAQERGSFDGGDQGLLNSFFKDWAHGDINKHLPFLYNVTSAAFYSYLPALKHYGQNLKIIHFIGAVKPWLQQFNWESRTVSAPDHLRELLQLWWDLFVSQVHSELDVAMVEGQEAQPDEPGVAPQDLSHYFHYQPIVNPESEFPWHHPDAQIHEEGSEPQIDMSDIHNPWQIYRGHIPPSKDDTSRRHSELGGGVNYEEIRKYAWDYQTQRNQPASHVQDTHQAYEQNIQQPYHDEHKHHHEDHQHHDQHQHHHFQHDHDHHHNHEQHQQHHDQQQYHNEHPQHHHEQHQQDHRHFEHVEHHWQPDQVHTYHDDHSHRVHEQSRVQEESWQQVQSQDHVHNYSNQPTQCNGHKDAHNHDLHYQHSSHTHSDHHSHNSSQTHNETYTASNKPHEHNNVTHIQSKELEVYHVHLDHVNASVRINNPPENKTQVVNGDISETESEFHEEVKPRHPYDGFYLRHRATIDSHGRKICSHEIPFLPPTPPESPLPEDDLVLEDILPTSDYDDQTGVAGNLARVAAGGAAREAVDELTRRQGWEAGHIDYMGADSFDNIWAKISRTLNQREPQPEAPAPVPTPETVGPVVEAPAAAPKSTDAPAPEKTEPTPVDAPAAIPATPVPIEEPVKVSPATPVEAPVPIETAAEPAVVPVTVKPVSAPVEAAPVAAAPEKAAPVETAPVAAAPVKAAPVETAPVAPGSVATPVPIETPPPSPVPVGAPTEIPKTVEAVEAAALKETAKESTAKTETVKAPAEVAAPAAVAKAVAESDVAKAATPEKASDSPPLANTPSKEAPPLPAAKSEERRKPAGKLQLRPPAAADPLPTPDSEQEDAASLASSIIAGELRTPTITPASASPPAPSPTAEAKRLSVEGPEVPTPPIGAVSLAQIGVKPAAKGKASTAAHIESSVTEGTEAPKKKLVKKVVKKEVVPGDAPVPPPRKKEKKPKDK